MAGHAAAVRHNGLGLFHGRDPVRGRHFRNKDFPLLEFVDAGRIQNDVGFARYEARAGRGAFDNDFLLRGGHSSLPFLLGILCFAARPDGFRTGLENPDLAVSFVDAPFHIHIAAVVFFNLDRVAGQFHNLGVRQLLFPSFFGRNADFFHIAARLADQFDFLGIDRLVHNGQGLFVDEVIVRRHRALDHVFTQAIGAFDQDVLVLAVGDVDREHDTSRLGIDHHLDDGGQGDIKMVKALLFAVIDGTVREAGSVAFLDFADNHTGPMDIQVRVLLSREAGVRQVFRRRGGADGDIGIFFPHLGAQFGIGLRNGVLQVLRHFLFHDRLPQLGADIPQECRVFHVRQLADQVRHLLLQAGLFNEITVRIGCGRETVRYGHIGLGGHFAQGRGFAAYNGDILALHLLEPQQVLFFFVHHIRSFCSFLLSGNALYIISVFPQFSIYYIIISRTFQETIGKFSGTARKGKQRAPKGTLSAFFAVFARLPCRFTPGQASTNRRHSGESSGRSPGGPVGCP